MAPPPPAAAPAPPLYGELRYGLELTRLLAARDFRRPLRARRRPLRARPARAASVPVLLVPGFMAGDASLSVLAGWLRRRGSRPVTAGMVLNTDCAERSVIRLQQRLRRASSKAGRGLVVIGQSRGGELARVLAVRNPELVSTLVMLGSPVLDPLSVGPAVLRAVRSVARLGDLGVPCMFSTRCGEGPCCSAFREDLKAPIPADVRAVAIYSRSDGIVSWQACLDPSAEHVEVRSSHGGMSVNADVYRVLAQVLDDDEAGQEAPWTG